MHLRNNYLLIAYNIWKTYLTRSEFYIVSGFVLSIFCSPLYPFPSYLDMVSYKYRHLPRAEDLVTQLQNRTYNFAHPPQYPLPCRLEFLIVLGYIFKVCKDGVVLGEIWSASVCLKNHHVITEFEIVGQQLT